VTQGLVLSPRASASQNVHLHSTFQRVVICACLLPVGTLEKSWQPKTVDANDGHTRW